MEPREIHSAENGHEVDTAKPEFALCRGCDKFIQGPGIFMRNDKPYCWRCTEEIEGEPVTIPLPYRIGISVAILAALIDMALFGNYTWPPMTNIFVIAAEIIGLFLFVEWLKPLWENKEKENGRDNV